MFVDAEAIAALNLRFRDKEGPTDVLAFPLDDEEERDEPPPPPFRPGTSPRLSGSGFPAVGPPRLLGDIVICPEVAAANAETHAGSFEDELALLIVHGILHLRGYDHEVEQEAAEMEQREARLLADCYGRTTAARSLEPLVYPDEYHEEQTELVAAAEPAAKAVVEIRSATPTPEIWNPTIPAEVPAPAVAPAPVAAPTPLPAVTQVYVHGDGEPDEEIQRRISIAIGRSAAD